LPENAGLVGKENLQNCPCVALQVANLQELHFLNSAGFILATTGDKKQ
jgi:hypothetical protein